MNHKELVGQIALRLGLSAEQVEKMVGVAAAAMAGQLAEGGSVGLQGFGTLEVRKREERISVHPATQVRTLVPPKLVVNFKQSNGLKERMKGRSHE